MLHPSSGGKTISAGTRDRGSVDICQSGFHLRAAGSSVRYKFDDTLGLTLTGVALGEAPRGGRVEGVMPFFRLYFGGRLIPAPGTPGQGMVNGAASETGTEEY